MAFVSCLISEFMCFYSFSILFAVLISRVAFLLCSRTRYVNTWFAYLDSFATLVFLCLTVLWPQNSYLPLEWRIRKDTGCTAESCRWVEKTVLCEDNNNDNNNNNNNNNNMYDMLCRCATGNARWMVDLFFCTSAGWWCVFFLSRSIGFCRYSDRKGSLLLQLFTTREPVTLNPTLFNSPNCILVPITINKCEQGAERDQVRAGSG